MANLFLNTSWISMEVLRNLKNALKIAEYFNHDWEKDYEKAWAVIAKEGGPPRFYVRALVAMEDAVTGVSRGDTKKMSQVNAKALSLLYPLLGGSGANDGVHGTHTLAENARGQERSH